MVRKIKYTSAKCRICGEISFPTRSWKARDSWTENHYKTKHPDMLKRLGEFKKKMRGKHGALVNGEV